MENFNLKTNIRNQVPFLE